MSGDEVGGTVGVGVDVCAASGVALEVEVFLVAQPTRLAASIPTAAKRKNVAEFFIV